MIEAVNQLHNEEKEENQKNKKSNDDMKFTPVKFDLINPKSINVDELFGNFDDQSPPQWMDGILSNILKKICQIQGEQRMMIIDGPVDTLWIESMNSVLDDSKLLTLNNGDRIALSPNVRLLFEVENLSVASPATVSRAGMIYMDIDELGWEPYVSMWIQQKEKEFSRLHLRASVDKYMARVLKVKKTSCKELVKTNETACVINFCKLYDAECSHIKKNEDESEEEFLIYLERWFAFCLIWSVGGTVQESSRKAIDEVLSDIESIFPHSGTIYEHFLDKEKRDWVTWESKLSQGVGRSATTEFHKIIVPTVDTHRNRHIV